MKNELKKIREDLEKLLEQIKALEASQPPGPGQEKPPPKP